MNLRLGQFEKLRDEFLASCSATAPLITQLREIGWQRFLQLGLPNRHVEAYKYLNLKHLQDTSFRNTTANTSVLNRSPLRQDLVGNIIAIHDGQVEIQTKLDDSLQMHSLANFVTNFPEQAGRIMDLGMSSFTQDAMHALGLAMCDRGFVLTIPKDTQLLYPIIIYHNVDQYSERSMVNILNAVIVEQGARCEIVEVFQGGGTESLYHNSCYFDVAKDAKLKRTVIQDFNPGTTCFDYSQFFANQDTSTEQFMFDVGADVAQHFSRIVLGGTNATATIDGALLVGAGQQLCQNLSVEHRVAETQSSQNSKAIVRENGRAILNGSIAIVKHAQKSNAFQSSKALLLNEHAEAYVKPELVIDADDVKCAHGATIGRLDDDEIFYLMSRAIPRPKAEAMLSRGFVESMISSDKLRALLHAKLDRFFGELTP